MDNQQEVEAYAFSYYHLEELSVLDEWLAEDDPLMMQDGSLNFRVLAQEEY